MEMVSKEEPAHSHFPTDLFNTTSLSRDKVKSASTNRAPSYRVSKRRRLNSIENSKRPELEPVSDDDVELYDIPRKSSKIAKPEPASDHEVGWYDIPEKKSVDEREALEKPVPLYDESERKDLDGKKSSSEDALANLCDKPEKKDPSTLPKRHTKSNLRIQQLNAAWSKYGDGSRPEGFDTKLGEEIGWTVSKVENWFCRQKRLDRGIGQKSKSREAQCETELMDTMAEQKGLDEKNSSSGDEIMTSLGDIPGNSSRGNRYTERRQTQQLHDAFSKYTGKKSKALYAEIGETIGLAGAQVQNWFKDEKKYPHKSGPRYSDQRSTQLRTKNEFMDDSQMTLDEKRRVFAKEAPNSSGDVPGRTGLPPRRQYQFYSDAQLLRLRAEFSLHGTERKPVGFYTKLGEEVGLTALQVSRYFSNEKGRPQGSQSRSIDPLANFIQCQEPRKVTASPAANTKTPSNMKTEILAVKKEEEEEEEKENEGEEEWDVLEIGKIMKKYQEMKSKDQRKVEKLKTIETEVKMLMLKIEDWFANQEE